MNEAERNEYAKTQLSRCIHEKDGWLRINCACCGITHRVHTTDMDVAIPVFNREGWGWWGNEDNMPIALCSNHCESAMKIGADYVVGSRLNEVVDLDIDDESEREE